MHLGNLNPLGTKPPPPHAGEKRQTLPHRSKPTYGSRSDSLQRRGLSDTFRTVPAHSRDYGQSDNSRNESSSLSASRCRLGRSVTFRSDAQRAASARFGSRGRGSVKKTERAPRPFVIRRRIASRGLACRGAGAGPPADLTLKPVLRALYLSGAGLGGSRRHRTCFLRRAPRAHLR